METKKNFYEAPLVEVLEVEVEAGFAQSAQRFGFEDADELYW